MIAKLEWTQSNAQQNIERLQNPTNQQQQNQRLRTDSSLTQCGGGGLMHFTGTKYSP